MFRKTKQLFEAWGFMAQSSPYTYHKGGKQKSFDVFKNPSRSEFHQNASEVSKNEKAMRLIGHKGNVHAWGWDHDVHMGVAEHPKLNHLPDDNMRADGVLVKHSDGNWNLFSHDIDHPEWKEGSKTMKQINRITAPAKVKARGEDYY